MNNHLRTFVLLAGLTALFMGIGYLIGGIGGSLIALVVAGGMNLFSYWNADKIVLRMYNAKPIDPASAQPLLRNFVADVHAMADVAGLPRPKVYVIETGQPNAFATGRNPENAAVAATVGLLQMLDRREVRAVMAHELAHVKNRDTLTMTVTATIAGAISMLANFAMFFGNRDRPGGVIGSLALMILAPLAAALVQMAISRGREYEADRGGADICGDPTALADALQKIEAFARGRTNHTAEANPASAQMFIINPLNGQGADNLFSTHPSTANRVAKLMAMGGGGPRRAAGPRRGTAVPVTGGNPWV